MNIQKLEDLKNTISKFIINNEPVSEKDADELAVKILYYLYAHYHNLKNITESYKSYIDTGFADKLIEVFDTQFPDVPEFIGEVTAKEFDDWYQKYI